MRQHSRFSQRNFRAILVLAVLLAGTTGLWRTVVTAQQRATGEVPKGTSTLTGKVTADKGEVRALRVRARNVGRDLAFTVFTVAGQYRIFNLPAGAYEVQVIEGSFTSPVQKVELVAGKSATADLAITQKPDANLFTDIAGQRFGAGGNVKSTQLAEFDEIYPPGPGRDLLMSECFGCHGPGWHRRGGKTEAEWARLGEAMFVESKASDQGESAGQHYARKIVGPGAMSPEDKKAIFHYLGTAFGPNYQPKELRLKPIVRDEESLSKAVFVQYQLPPLADLTKARARGLNRGTHDIFPSTEAGKVWVAGFRSSSVLQVDINNPDPKARVKEWDIPSEYLGGAGPHGIVESNGYVYWTAQNDDMLGSMNIKTGEIKSYPGTKNGGPHTLRADSKGNVYWTETGGKGALGRLDAKTREVKLFDVKKNANWYGIVADQQDRIWAAGMSRNSLAMFDPKVGSWKLFSPPNQVRRLVVDSKGNIWANSYPGNSEIMFDPKTEKFTEYKMPLENGNPYEGWIDNEDNLWLEVAAYNSLAKLDAKTKKWTYFPMPVLNGHAPKMESDKNGTLWFGMGGALTNFKPMGNIP